MDIDEFCTNRMSLANSVDEITIGKLDSSAVEGAITSPIIKEPFKEAGCVTETGVSHEQPEKLADDVENYQLADDGKHVCLFCNSYSFTGAPHFFLLCLVILVD